MNLVTFDLYVGHTPGNRITFVCNSLVVQLTGNTFQRNEFKIYSVSNFGGPPQLFFNHFQICKYKILVHTMIAHESALITCCFGLLSRLRINIDK